MNPAAGAVFSGVILIVLVYSILDLTGAASQMGFVGTMLPIPLIGALMAGIYLGLKRFKQRKISIGLKGPLYLRSLMKSCLQRTCGNLESMLNSPQFSSATILSAILLDKMFRIGTTDCRRYIDIRRQIEDSGMKGTADLVLSCFFQTVEEYREQELPLEIRRVDELAGRGRTDLQSLLKRLKDAHRRLCTGTGDILSLLPPDPKKAEKIRAGCRFTPPTKQSARRIAFALETLAYLKAVRYKNVSPMDRQRYDAAAAHGIPKLGTALKEYKQAWKNLADAYEQPKD